MAQIRRRHACMMSTGWQKSGNTRPVVRRPGGAAGIGGDATAGFSLMELVIVMALMAILAALAAPGAQRAMMAYQLNLGTEMFAGTLGYARQAATTMNRDVEVRLLTLAVSSATPAVQRVRGIQVFDTGEGSPKALAVPRYLPEGIMVNTNPAFSTIARLPEETPGATDPDLPGYGRSYKIRRFRFRPDGSSNLPQLISSPAPAQFFMSMHRDVPNSDTALPANFSSIQIEPSTGAVSVYRP